MAKSAKPATTVEIDVKAACSGDGWAAPKGRYECSPKLAKMLVDRGYATPIKGAGE